MPFDFLNLNSSLLLTSGGVLSDVLAILEVCVELVASLTHSIDEGPHT